MGAAGNNAIESSVGVFIDGVYYPRPGSVIGLLMDINSFEVLRGPQGTLFGRNTVAGAMNITTRNPSQETEGTIEAGFGDYDLYEVSVLLRTCAGKPHLPLDDSACQQR
jgi:iron complex outermembrane receptor protein